MSDLITVHYYGSDVEVPKDTRYIATDSDGCVYAFNNDKPVFNEKSVHGVFTRILLSW